MPRATLDDVIHFLHRVCTTGQQEALTDGQLIERFAKNQDQAAFSCLVRRHGSMVLGVCRRVLGDAHLAEDAFQATFLVLVRRAATLNKSKPLGGWLYTVAQRVATKGRALANSQRLRERRMSPMASPAPLDELSWQELMLEYHLKLATTARSRPGTCNGRSLLLSPLEIFY
jgi:DNA-directed RNA polymerase specialized sigma24 family protein